MGNTRNDILTGKTSVVALMTALSVFIAFAGFFYFRNAEKTIRQEKENELKAIAELKIKQIAAWHKDEVNDAALIARSPFLLASITAYLSGRGEKSELVAHLTQIKEEHGYKDIILVSPDGKLLSSTDRSLRSLDTLILTGAKRAIQEKTTTYTDIQKDRTDDTMRIDFISAVTDRNNSVVAALVFQVDPDDFLYPLIEFWPTSSKASETYIARKEGDSILVLSRLKLLNKPALSHSYSLTDTKSAIVKAVQGHTGFIDATDYRGINVLAYTSAVPGTPWFMVAKVDRVELFESVYYEAGIIAVFVVLLILLIGTSLSFIYRRRSEKALRESEAFYRNLFENHAAIKLMIDPDTGNIIDANDAAADFYGWSRQQLRQMKIQEINTLSPERIAEEIEKVRSGKQHHFEFRHRRADGSIRDVEVFSGKIASKGKDLLNSIIHDITDRRRLEDQLVHAQKLEGVGQLAGGIAHDFNNVLTAVVGFAGLLQMKMDRADPLRHYVDEIMTASRRGAELTRQILAFSRKQVLDMRPAKLNEIVKSIEKMLHRLVREDISIQLKLCEKDLMIIADASQIGQVLINLATNAHDAMPEGGRLSISTEPFAMDREFVEMHGYGSPGEYALLTVSDSGCGMNTETRAHIFEPFFTTKEVGKGTGLGLAVAHGIIKQHNGFIAVHTEVGKGTIFKIYLPLTGHADKETDEKAEDRIRDGTETILIAEDDAALRELFRTVLGHYGYTVIEAADGEDAVLKFAGNKDLIKLAILDGIMPKKNGKEAFDEMRRLCPGVKAIFLSGYAADIFSQEGMSERSVMFIQKPVTPESLLRKVREALDG